MAPYQLHATRTRGNADYKTYRHAQKHRHGTATITNPLSCTGGHCLVRSPVALQRILVLYTTLNYCFSLIRITRAGWNTTLRPGSQNGEEEG